MVKKSTFNRTNEACPSLLRSPYKNTYIAHKLRPILRIFPLFSQEIQTKTIPKTKAIWLRK